MPLHLYNSLTRQKEEFKPLRDGYVGMYVCGPTVYSHSHIGHGKSYVSFDVIVRYLRYLGYKVLYVQNITDVGHLLGDANDGEDRLLKQSRIEQKHPMEVAEEYTYSYFEDMDALGLVRPDISPRATGHIIEQIELTKKLVEKGYAYEANGSVYFDVRKFADYGKLSRRPLDEMVEGTRVEVRSEKRSPQDFALWKKAGPEHILRWPSPWGEGFPGWHIECSAMSMKYLGESFDIHGGGLDNQFPHHECEIAQSVCATDKSFVKYWLHNNLVTVNGQKMSKSLGNFVTLKDAFEKFDPLVVRFFILQSHYRSTLDFSDEAIESAGKGLKRLVETLDRISNEIKKGKVGNIQFTELEEYKKRFFDAMNDDFNTPQAIGVLQELAAATNTLMAKTEDVSTDSLIDIFLFFMTAGWSVLGFFKRAGEYLKANELLDALVKARKMADEVRRKEALKKALEELGFGVVVTFDDSIAPKLLEILISTRNEARKQKLFALSDLIRDGLKKIGIVLEDKKDETVWKQVE
ncbi:MAG: cysteine--tRNA ligase [Bacteroidota bacterium]